MLPCPAYIQCHGKGKVSNQMSVETVSASRRHGVRQSERAKHQAHSAIVRREKMRSGVANLQCSRSSDTVALISIGDVPNGSNKLLFGSSIGEAGFSKRHRGHNL